GNFVMSRPVGVLDGVDYGFTGRVRKVDAQAIQQFLDQQAIVLLPSIGYSLTGEAFNLSYEDVAASVASAIGAHKLIMFSEQGGILDGNGDLIRELSLARAQRLLAQVEGVPPQDALDPECRDLLAFICTACHQGVDRSYVLSFQHEGALLQEMFTRDGLGTMISAQDYEQIRPAKLTDIGGISELLRPLEEQGILIRRSRELLEMEIDKFTVDERDGGIIGCAALYPYPSERIGELACFAVSSRYRRHGRGDTLLQIIEDKARRLKLNRIFALTTQTEHWFRERGFVPASINELPESKRAAYNNQRNSKLFIKML
ncbi:MAG: amino-acid N-acetyltransferase, partial [Pseudomonadales bacterium]|nr:amino-acid N-acetyltransferase [Pseudomonadales bacterium]